MVVRSVPAHTYNSIIFRQGHVFYYFSRMTVVLCDKDIKLDIRFVKPLFS